MTKSMMSATVLAVITGGAVVAQERSAAGVAGRWTMTVEGGAHGVMTMGMALEQEGEEVTGTFARFHGDMPVRGKFAGGTLELKTVSEDRDAPPITFTARLQDGKLTGHLSSAMGDMTWTATRTRDAQ
ncbi:MAG TPA: hypothetical protein VD833_07960 [Vicinamibacterales bacterium]|nr:hypothetical protein [Vicinamibacterales bacterium]